MKKFIYLFLLIANFLISSTYGWWDLGHMAVAKICYDNLDPDVKERADYLIGLWKNDHPKSCSFCTSACFADDLKDEGNRAFDRWHGSALVYDPCCQLTQDQIIEHNQTLVNRDALFAMEKSIEVLSNPAASDWNKAFFLRMCIHIAGDLHQPLHNATLFSQEFPYPKGDVAGTRFPIYCDLLGGKTTLHNLWDSACGLDSHRINRPLNTQDEKIFQDFLVQIFKYPCSFKPEEIDNINFSTWKNESYCLAVEYAYKGIYPFQNASDCYLKNGQRISAQQIQKAGLRLAYLLNTYLK